MKNCKEIITFSYFRKRKAGREYLPKKLLGVWPLPRFRCLDASRVAMSLCVLAIRSVILMRDLINWPISKGFLNWNDGSRTRRRYGQCDWIGHVGIYYSLSTGVPGVHGRKQGVGHVCLNLKFRQNFPWRFSLHMIFQIQIKSKSKLP